MSEKLLRVEASARGFKPASRGAQNFILFRLKLA
jgi:hypothetical protein